MRTMLKINNHCPQCSDTFHYYAIPCGKCDYTLCGICWMQHNAILDFARNDIIDLMPKYFYINWPEYRKYVHENGCSISMITFTDYIWEKYHYGWACNDYPEGITKVIEPYRYDIVPAAAETAISRYKNGVVKVEDFLWGFGVVRLCFEEDFFNRSTFKWPDNLDELYRARNWPYGN